MEILDRQGALKLGKVRFVTKAGNEIVEAVSVFEQAEEAGMDLVLVSAEVKPPVVRIQDYKKIQYEKKKARKASNAKKSTLKEMQFKANISDHDLDTKINSIEKFLDRGDKVKIVVRLKGRERENPERAQAVIDRVVEKVPCKVSRLAGPMATAILEPEK